MLIHCSLNLELPELMMGATRLPRVFLLAIQSGAFVTALQIWSAAAMPQLWISGPSGVVLLRRSIQIVGPDAKQYTKTGRKIFGQENTEIWNRLHLFSCLFIFLPEFHGG